MTVSDIVRVSVLAVCTACVCMYGCASESVRKSTVQTDQAAEKPAHAAKAADTVYVPDEPVVSVNKCDTPPQILRSVSPEYTYEMVQNNVAGYVTANVLVGSSGKVLHVKIERHLGYGTDIETRKAIGQYSFSAARKDGKRVATWITLTVKFSSMRKS